MSDGHRQVGLGDVMTDDHEHFESRAARRRAQHHHARRRRRKGKRLGVLVVTLIVVALGAVGAVVGLRPLVSSFTATNDYTGPGSGSVTVTIQDGASGREIGQALQRAGVVKSAKAFVDVSAGNPKAAAIQPGDYRLRRQMSASAALALLLDPAARSVQRVTVREGLRANEIVALLAQKTGQPAADYAAALKDVQALGVPASAKGKVEGWLFPDTYEFGSRTTAAQQLSRMVAQTRAVLSSLGISDAQAPRVLTIASIAEVEAGSPADYAKVARVVDNRLADKQRNGGKLQLDSTVSYAVGKRTLTTTAAERAVNSPYNTYRFAGLPAGPISNPGKAAIQGALKPTPGPWLYFVTVNPSTGETKFAVTAAQHAVYVKQFQAWCKANPGKC